MRTTLDIDADVLQAAKEMASVQGTTVGRVISDLVRKALAPAPPITRMRNGVPLMPSRGPGAPKITMRVRQRTARRAVSRVALLDVNVLVALFDPDHVHHAHVRRTTGSSTSAGAGWATCPARRRTDQSGRITGLSNSQASPRRRTVELATPDSQHPGLAR